MRKGGREIVSDLPQEPRALGGGLRRALRSEEILAHPSSGCFGRLAALGARADAGTREVNRAARGLFCRDGGVALSSSLPAGGGGWGAKGKLV